jgi:hypothetical protein
MASTSKGSVQIEGLNKKIRALQELGVELDDLKDVFAKVAAEGADVASSFAPVQSGALRSSIRGNRAKNKAVITAGRARVPYAGAINYGWPARNISGALFLQKADVAMEPKARQAIIEGLDALIREKGFE